MASRSSRKVTETLGSRRKLPMGWRETRRSDPSHEIGKFGAAVRNYSTMRSG